MPSFGYMNAVTVGKFQILHMMYLANDPKHGKVDIIAILMREVIKSMIISKEYQPTHVYLSILFFSFFFC